MKGLWTFSPSSALLVQRCIEAAGEMSKNNKWAKAFKRGNSDPNDSIGTEISANYASANITISHYEENDNSKGDQRTVNDKIVCEIIETDLDAKWSFILEECTKDITLFTSIATNISEVSLEKFYNKVYDSSDNIDNEFVIGYMRMFLPTYLKIWKSRFTLDLIVRAFKYYPSEFKTVFIPCLLKELDIPNNILHDFVQTLNVKEKTDLLTNICGVKLIANEFEHHLTSLCNMYKDCEPTPCIQSYIISNLEENCEFNCNDINFGRLLLAFMQKCNNKPVYVNTLGRIILTHQSAYKRPCMNKFESDFKNYD